MKSRQPLIGSEEVKISKQTAQWDYSQKNPILRIKASTRVGDGEGACYVKLRFIRLSTDSQGKEKQLIQRALRALSEGLGVPGA